MYPAGESVPTEPHEETLDREEESSMNLKPIVSRMGASVVLAALAAAAPASAQPAPNPCDNITPDNTGTVSLPPQGCAYLSPQDVHRITDGLPPGTTIELGAIHQEFICRGGNPLPGQHCGQPGGTLGGEREQFGSNLTLHLRGTGTLAGWSRTVSLPVNCVTDTGPTNPTAPVQSFPTKMIGAQGQISGDPDFDLLRVTAGQVANPPLPPGPGHTTLTRQPNGNWAVDSFFDITYRIEYQGAAGGHIPGITGSTTGTIRMSTGLNALPTMSEWGLAISFMLILTAGAWLLARRIRAPRLAA
jgi:hypothetical protein